MNLAFFESSNVLTLAINPIWGVGKLEAKAVGIKYREGIISFCLFGGSQDNFIAALPPVSRKRA